MEKENVSYIFGKTLTEHLKDSSTNNHYLEARFNRFYEEFLSQEGVQFDQIEMVLSAIYEYLEGCMEAQELDHCLLNLKQSIYWLAEYSGAEYE